MHRSSSGESASAGGHRRGSVRSGRRSGSVTSSTTTSRRASLLGRFSRRASVQPVEDPAQLIVTRAAQLEHLDPQTLHNVLRSQLEEVSAKPNLRPEALLRRLSQTLDTEVERTAKIISRRASVSSLASGIAPVEVTPEDAIAAANMAAFGSISPPGPDVGGGIAGAVATSARASMSGSEDGSKGPTSAVMAAVRRASQVELSDAGSNRPSVGFAPAEAQLRLSSQRTSIMLADLVHQIKSTGKSKWVVHPDNSVKHAWDLLIMAFVLYNVIYIPYQMAFSLTSPDGVVALDYVIDACFITDVAINFRTLFMDKDGRLEYDTWKIARNYLSFWFWIDLVACIPTELIGYASGWDSQTLALLKTPRLLRLSRILKFIERHEFANIWRIMQYFLGMVLVGHWIACGWIAIVEGDGECEARALEPPYDCVPGSHRETYMAGLYAAFLSLVGSDVSPRTLNQRLFSSVTLLVGACFYATIVGNMALLVANFNITQTRQRQKLDMVVNAMRQYQLPQETTEKVIEYYTYITRSNKDSEALMLLRELPPSMFADIANYLHRDMVEKVPMFHGCNPGFITALVTRLVPHVYLANQVIIRAGDIGKEAYFISRGAVEVAGAEGKRLAVLREGAFFGEIAVLIATTRTASVTAITLCDLNLLMNTDLIDVLQDFPEEAEKFRKLVHERLEKLEQNADSSKAKESANVARRKSVAMTGMVANIMANALEQKGGRRKSIVMGEAGLGAETGGNSFTSQAGTPVEVLSASFVDNVGEESDDGDGGGPPLHGSVEEEDTNGDKAHVTMRSRRSSGGGSVIAVGGKKGRQPTGRAFFAVDDADGGDLEALSGRVDALTVQLEKLESGQQAILAAIERIGKQ